MLGKIIKGNGEKVKILDGIWVEGWIEKNIFEIAIVDGKGNPIICSFGTTKEEEKSTLAHHIMYRRGETVKEILGQTGISNRRLYIEIEKRKIPKREKRRGSRYSDL